jgi:hypothetical protein
VSVLEPIAKYHERIVGLVDRTFLLLPDRVIIQGRVRANRFEIPIALQNLNPDPGTIWSRSKHFEWALMINLLTVPYAVGALIIPILSTVPQIVSISLWVSAFVLLLVSVSYFVTSARRIRFAQFRNVSGIVVLDFGEVGPDKQNYDRFLQTLVEQIRRANSKEIVDNK